MPSSLSVHRHTKASSAYAEAMTAIGEELAAIAKFGDGHDCRRESWDAAELATRLALRLAVIRRQFCEDGVR